MESITIHQSSTCQKADFHVKKALNISLVAANHYVFNLAQEVCNLNLYASSCV